MFWAQKSTLPFSGLAILVAIITVSFPGSAAAQRAWVEKTPDVPPSPEVRFGHGMVFHDSTGVTVLFGGFVWENKQYVDRNDTWELKWEGDGYRWVKTLEHNPDGGTNQPPPRRMMGMCEGPEGSIIIYGGLRDVGIHPQALDDIWCYDPSAHTWTQIVVNPIPDARRGHAMAYDSNRGVIVIFSGYRTGYLSDTCEISKQGSSWQWTQRQLAGPSPRMAHMMAYDKGRGKIVLFGGWDLYSDYGDTWEYDGESWTKVAETGPASRGAVSMTYDEAKGRIVLFGGRSKSGVYYSDTWEWDGRAWSRIDDQPGGLEHPRARIWSPAVYDGRRNWTLIFGGADSNSSFNDTWVYLTPNSPPRIIHIPVAAGLEGIPITIEAQITDPDGDPVTAMLLYRITGGANFSSKSMRRGDGDGYSADIPGVSITPAGVEYYIRAGDGSEITEHGSLENPHRIAVLATYGSLQVTIEPLTVRDAGAAWRRVGTKQWLNSGFTEGNIPSGIYEVEFKPADDLSCWTTPGNKSATIIAGGKTVLIASYQECGNIRVFLEPEEWADAGAGWRLVWPGREPSGWYESGVTALYMPVGDCRIEVADLPGWMEPAPLETSITQCETVTVTLTASVPAGLTVVAGPSEAVADGAMWRVVDQSDWLESGFTLIGLPEGEYKIEFTEIDGWTKPEDIEIEFDTEGLLIDGPESTYYVEDGKLRVIIQPARARSDGAKWSIAGTDEWYDSGRTIRSVEGPEVTIRFSKIPVWIDPPEFTVPVDDVKKIIVNGPESTYTALMPSATTVMDFDGDGVSDISYFRPEDRSWHFYGSRKVIKYGGPYFIPVPGDYDGDGFTDVAYFKPNGGVWSLRGSETVKFGKKGDIPVPGDYDGDGRTDIAVYRPSTGDFLIRNGEARNYGLNAGSPFSVDLDGGGVDEVAFFVQDEGRWVVDGETVFSGCADDIPAPADYDGDGATDLAVFRRTDGLWLIGQRVLTQFGELRDIPVPGDYDGDGKADVAVFRSSEGKWIVKGLFEIDFGQEGDVPLIRGK